MMPIMEDEHGTYIMNSKDLRGIEVVEKLAKIGVDSLKVEGRTKSLYYVARVAQSYRKAIDDAVAGRPFDYSLLSKLEGLANRGYTSGFLERHQTQDYQNYLTGHPSPNKANMSATLPKSTKTAGRQSKSKPLCHRRFTRNYPSERQPNHQIGTNDPQRPACRCCPRQRHSGQNPQYAGQRKALVARIMNPKHQQNKGRLKVSDGLLNYLCCFKPVLAIRRQSILPHHHLPVFFWRLHGPRHRRIRQELARPPAK